MKKFILITILSLFSLNASELNLQGGWRRDELKWSIAGFQDTPNILSELTWDDLNIALVSGRAILDLPVGLIIKAEGDYGKILSGEVQDSDYFGDNRTIEFSRSNSDAGKGEVYDLSAAVGYPLMDYELFSLVTYGGYSSHHQNLRIYNGRQTVESDFSPPIGPIPGLDSKYDARWSGPWVGAEADINLWDVLLSVTYEYHWGRYRGKGFWNLRQDLVGGFTHTADMHGNVLKARIEKLFNCWLLGLEVSGQEWRSQDGHDETPFIDPEVGLVIGQTKLNPVKWRSIAIQATAGIMF